MANVPVSMIVSDPVWKNPKPGFVSNASKQLTSWTHQINAVGGYATASFTMTGTVGWMDEFFVNGLGRDVVLRDSHLDIVWEGFINRIVYNYAEQAMVNGPLMSVANRVKLIFTPYIDVTVTPPTSGSAQETIYVQDATSQALWGVRESVISTGNLIIPSTVGGGGADEATQVRNAYLDYLKSPEKSQEVQYGGDVTPSIVFECLGYSAMFDAYTHTSNAAGYQTFTDKLLAVVASDPNLLFSGDLVSVEANPEITAKRDRNRTATTILNEIASKGDVNYDRWIWGVLSGRKLYYKPAPFDYKYIYRRGKLYLASNNSIVLPWQVVSGEWVFYADMVHRSPGGSSPTTTVDPQSSLYGFIESVNFTSPYSVQLSGRRITSIGQLLAQKGLSL